MCIRQKHQKRSARRGYLYLAVMGTAVVVSVLGMTALSISNLKLRSAATNQNWLEAELLARAALEDALLEISDDNGWRGKYDNNREYPNDPEPLGNGTYTYKFVDDDGDIEDDDADSVKLVGIGRVGSATVAESIRLLPSGTPLTCLETSLHSNGNITLGTLVNWTTTQIVSTNGNFSASALLSSLTGAVDAVGTITGTTSGINNPGITPGKMPTSAAFEYYKDNGTWISFASLPLVSGIATIEKIVLSPGNNGYGPAKNPEGIYIIDCGGSKIVIQNCRIYGTLVLLNPHPNSQLKGCLCWTAAVANYPALLVDGTIECQTVNSDLSESYLGTNFNPPGSPYLGNSDTTTSDTYPSEINGIIYISNTLNLSANLLGPSNFRGSVICNALTANANARFNYRSFLKDNPPPGFSRGNPMMVSPGSRKRESL